MPTLISPTDVLNQGDIFWGEASAASGSEQAGDRPWVVMSRRAINGANTVVAVPLSRRMEKASKYPHFCILIPAAEALPIPGQTASVDRVALCHQVRVVDKAMFREKWGKLTLAAISSIQLGLQWVFDAL